MANALTQNMASTYIQTQLGKPLEYLGECVDIDTIPSPINGGVEYIWCKNRANNGTFKRVGQRTSPPGNIEFSLMNLATSDASYVENLHCLFNIYNGWSECGSLGVAKNWDLMAAVIGATATSNDLQNVNHRTDQNELNRDVPVTAAPPRLDMRRITAGRSTTTQTVALNAITNAAALYCGDSCGAYRTPNDVLYAVADGEVAASANVLKSSDGGITWAALAADPFGVNINLLSVAVFDIDRNTQRILVARAGVAATPMAVAYSDDDGVSWTLVTVGAINVEGATGPRSLFAIDSENIWVCTDSGNVYKSTDGGETWTLQSTAATAGGGNDLNCVHFADEMIGMAVGDTDTVILTQNGGQTWYAGAATGNGNDILSCWAFDKYRMIVGTVLDATGSLWMTFNGAQTGGWEAKQFVGWTTETVSDMYFYNGARGFIVTLVGGVSSLHFCFEGGNLWEEMTIPTNAGVNAIIATSINKIAMVGEAQGGSAYIATAN